MEESHKILDEIVKRLNILIALSLDDVEKNGLSMADKIVKLSDLGISPTDIARILGKSTNYVTATLSQRKTRKMKGSTGGE